MLRGETTPTTQGKQDIYSIASNRYTSKVFLAYRDRNNIKPYD